MHFFYIDESGDTGANLNDPNQPIMVLGGISLRDEGWNKTQAELSKLLHTYFNAPLPSGFELHANELLSPNGNGPFAGHPLADRHDLAKSLLNLIRERSHGVHLFAIDKTKVAAATCNYSLSYNSSVPYLLAFDYLVTYINWYVKERLGASARGMVIFDEKQQFHPDIERITNTRRFEGAQAHRVKWIVEFSYSVNSKKNPMIQLSDLVLYCARGFLELDCGHHTGWPQPAVQFCAECYSIINDRIAHKSIVPRDGRDANKLNDYLEHIQCKPRTRWHNHYGV